MKNNNFIWGIILVIIGILVLLNVLDIMYINVFFKGWWTLFIIIPSLIGLIRDNDKTGSLIGLLIGVSLLLGVRGVLDIDLLLKLLLPVILILVGISIMIKSAPNKKVKSKKEIKEYGATFSSQKIDYDNEVFTGCKLNAIFGGAVCDLTKAKIKEDAVIEATCIFGGIDIKVPDNVNIKTSSTCVFGGIDNKTKNGSDNSVTIYIYGTCLFGGIDIK